MVRKKKSEGNIFDFIDDAAKNPNLHRKMLKVISTKGEGMTPEGFLKEFHTLGYERVNLQDCKKVLQIIREDIVDPAKWDWSY